MILRIAATFFALVLSFSGCGQPPANADQSTFDSASTDSAIRSQALPAETSFQDVALAQDLEPGEFPRRREIEGASLIVHAPQIRAWPEFSSFESQIAIELQPHDSEQRLIGVARLKGDTEVDLAERMVVVSNAVVDGIDFGTQDLNKRWSTPIQASVQRTRIDVPVDLFLSYIADSAYQSVQPDDFNIEPPQVVVSQAAALLLFIDGEAIHAPIDGVNLELVPNASYPLLRNPADQRYYLAANEGWLTSLDLAGEWTPISALPGEFDQLPDDESFQVIREALPAQAWLETPPAVFFTAQPTELIVIEGELVLAELEGAPGLEYVSNTRSPLFSLNKNWYFLTAGRWFTTTNLNDGQWAFEPQLPEVFQLISADSEIGYVRASIAGTPEARLAVLEAMLPQRKTVAVGVAPDVEVTYSGEPVFEVIAGTDIDRAMNTGFDVLRFAGRYYFCYQGVWYVSDGATGPWLPATSIPEAFSSIPPSSPAYATTSVAIDTVYDNEVVYSYTPGYSSNVYVYYGVPVYGTGWYYRPYIRGLYFYPFYHAYGHGHWYNHATGRFGSYARWYGPFGGYTYANGFNPRTGRYGWAESERHYGGWEARGETYNPRTGIYTNTRREYDYDDERLTQRRTIERGNQSMDVKRTRDYDDDWSKVEASTSRGGEFEARRDFDDGRMQGSGTIETAAGRKAEFESEFDRGGSGTIDISGEQGGRGSVERERAGNTVVREGEFSNDGNTLGTKTERQGDRVRTEFETDSGGRGVSVKDDGERRTVGQSAGGDLYAGGDGGVYKRTDEGWQKYDSGNWRSAGSDRQATTSKLTTQRIQPKTTANTGRVNPGTRQVPSRNSTNNYNSRQQLNRDYSRRQAGYDRSRQIRSSNSRLAAQRRGGVRMRRR